jgi:hypothetical protein
LGIVPSSGDTLVKKIDWCLSSWNLSTNTVINDKKSFKGKRQRGITIGPHLVWAQVSLSRDWRSRVSLAREQRGRAERCSAENS